MDGPEEPRSARVVAELLADFGNDARHGCLGDKGARPDPIKQFRLREGTRTAFDEAQEELECLWREMNRRRSEP
jgi:hypothetical protein